MFFEFGPTTYVDQAHRELADALNRLHAQLVQQGAIPPLPEINITYNKPEPKLHEQHETAAA